MPFQSPIMWRVCFLLLLSTSRCWAQNCQHGLTANDIAADSGKNLTGKVALVTGGRSGLGYAISEALLRTGCKVVIASRNEALNQQAVANLTATVPGANISYMIFDLESFNSTREFASNFSSTHTQLDYYFGNAGQGAFGAQPLTEDGYERIFQVNYVGQVLLLNQLLPLLRQSDEEARVLLTASSTHTTACGALGLRPEDTCWQSDAAMDMLPFNQAGLDAVDSKFQCPPLNGTYPVTKFLMTQLAREISERESANGVVAYSWAPGNINTDLNPWATCCVGPLDNTAEGVCNFQLPYVGPVNDDGSPNPPTPPVPNRWTDPTHGAMAAIYTALVADTKDGGSFFATYWECEAEKGYFPQGITKANRAEIYNRSLEWTEGVIAESTDMPATSAAATLYRATAVLSALVMSTFRVGLSDFESN